MEPWKVTHRQHRMRMPMGTRRGPARGEAARLRYPMPTRRSSRPRRGIAMRCIGSGCRATVCAMTLRGSGWRPICKMASRWPKRWHAPAWTWATVMGVGGGSRWSICGDRTTNDKARRRAGLGGDRRMVQSGQALGFASSPQPTALCFHRTIRKKVRQPLLRRDFVNADLAPFRQRVVKENIRTIPGYVLQENTNCIARTGIVIE